MNLSPLIFSIIANPFPIFVEGNIETYRTGRLHPRRKNLGYFDIIIVIEGTLYLTENDINYEIKKNEAIVLSPVHLHYSYKKSQDNTSFYWLHFYTESEWLESHNPVFLNSTFKIPQLHFHNKIYTLHLPKHQAINNSRFIIQTITTILDNTKKNDDFTFFENQKLFIDLLKQLELRKEQHNTSQQLAESIKDFLYKSISQKIDAETLSQEFHFHYNYLSRVMKKYYGTTPIEYLNELRLVYAADLLLQTNHSIQYIAANAGFQTPPYFSNCFKKKYLLSPRHFRNRHSSQSAAE